MGAGVQLQRGRFSFTLHRFAFLSQRDQTKEHQTIARDRLEFAAHEYISALQPPGPGSEYSSLVVDRCHAVCHPLDTSHLPAASSNINSLDLETRSGTQLHWLTGAVADLGTRAPAYDWLQVETHYFQSCSSTSHSFRRLPKSGQQPPASVSRGALRSNPCSIRPLIGSTTVPPAPHRRQLDSP
ncbi:hypothetical protein SVAN01_05054 [Stagonosporopsis vannaccii]|nr:hypothetical protein SVAN01_05054 [Stagonosporopsis vannaccii]